MNAKEIKIVKKAIHTYGDDFWTDPVESKHVAPNDSLFDEVLSFLEQEGLTLKIIPMTPEEIQRLKDQSAGGTK